MSTDEVPTVSHRERFDPPRLALGLKASRSAERISLVKGSGVNEMREGAKNLPGQVEWNQEDKHPRGVVRVEGSY